MTQALICGVSYFNNKKPTGKGKKLVTIYTLQSNEKTESESLMLLARPIGLALWAGWH